MSGAGAAIPPLGTLSPVLKVRPRMTHVATGKVEVSEEHTLLR